MCPKCVIDIRVPWRVDDYKLMGPPIIELEIEKNKLDPHIIVGGESIPLRMKKEKPTLCERCFQLGHPKRFCWELSRDCTEPLLQRTPQDRKQKNVQRIYNRSHNPE